MDKTSNTGRALVNKNYLFICGAGRSGTTLLWKILNNSQSVHLATEIHYFSSLFHDGFLHNHKKLSRKTKKASLDNLICCLTKIEHFGMYWEKSRSFDVQEIKDYFNSKDINDKVIYEYLIHRDLQEKGKHKNLIKYVGEKTPLNIFHVGRLFKWFPNAKILFLYRNPIDVLRSEVNKSDKPDYPLGKKNPIYAYGLVVFVFFEWLFAAIIALYNKYIHKDKFIGISYGALTLQQKKSVASICSEIGIEYSDDLCIFKKIASSYSEGERKQYWYPPKAVKFVYKLCLQPLCTMLNKKALNSIHALGK